MQFARAATVFLFALVAAPSLAIFLADLAALPMQQRGEMETEILAETATGMAIPGVTATATFWWQWQWWGKFHLIAEGNVRRGISSRQSH